jgi:hypothetical protein
MTAMIAPLPGLDISMLTSLAFSKRHTATTAAPAPTPAANEIPVNRAPEARINRLLRFRQQNPGLFERRRIEGMKRSPLVRDNLMRLHRERKAEWRASALKNPKLRATDLHIAAKEWVLRGPDGQVFQFRNLKKWVREHEELFDPTDVVWKEMNGVANQAWCRAFQALGRLRPTSSKHIPEWNGWKWAAAA